MSSPIEPEQEQEVPCHHCGEVLPVSLMEPLDDGTPSNMCKREWAEYKQSSIEWGMRGLKGGWSAERAAEEVEGERREAERKLSRKEKANAKIAGHSLRLVK